MTKPPDNRWTADKHNERGIELADRGWLDEAVNEFRKAVDADPDAPHAYGNLGTTLAEQGELSSALLHLSKAISLGPDASLGYHYLASFLLQHHQELINQLLKKALELDPELAEARINLAYNYSDQGNVPGALDQLNIANSIAPDDLGIRHERACCMVDLGHYPEAIAELKDLLIVDPHHLQAKVDLGIAYTAQGFFEQAHELLLNANEQDPHDFSARYHLAALLSNWQKTDKALEILLELHNEDAIKLRNWLHIDRTFDPLNEFTQFRKLLKE